MEKNNNYPRIHVRLSKNLLKRIEEWAAEQGDISRSAAIRVLIQRALKSK